MWRSVLTVLLYLPTGITTDTFFGDPVNDAMCQGIPSRKRRDMSVLGKLLAPYFAAAVVHSDVCRVQGSPRSVTEGNNAVMSQGTQDMLDIPYYSQHSFHTHACLKRF